jgi:hypothetical protein
MSLEFVIIPLTNTMESNAYDIKNKLISSINHAIHIEIDQNYSFPISSRISKWKKNEFDIITIDHEFTETNTIVVRFSDKNSRPKAMSLEEFIDLVDTLEDDEHFNNEDTIVANTEDSGCIIM